MTTTTELIDAPRALALLEEAVAERGEDYIYRDFCYYVLDESGSGNGQNPPARCGCLVGLALHKGGVTLQEMAQFNSLGAERLGEFLPLTESAVEVFKTAQDAQDARLPYGEVLAKARLTAEQFQA